MNAAAGAVVGVLALTLVIVVAVGWMLWSTRIGRGGGSAAARYRRSHMDLHSVRNRRAMKAKRRRKRWAAGSGGAAGGGFMASDGGCGGGAGCGGGS